jgi:hypothetical protein
MAMMLFKRCCAAVLAAAAARTPLQFAQIRRGFHWKGGIPQDPSERRHLHFIELRGFI